MKQTALDLATALFVAAMVAAAFAEAFHLWRI